MSCRLSLFGPPTLLDGSGRAIPFPAKAFALVAYLLMSSGGAPVSRASLRQFLWDDSDRRTAANLRKFLLRIRHRQEEFGFELIREERNHVRLAPNVQIDLDRFFQIAGSDGDADLVALCDLYRGELLEGLLFEEQESREWLQVQRTKIRDAFISAVAAALDSTSSSSDRVAERVAARRLIEVDPYNETGHRALMRLFAEEGAPARVRDIYRNLQRRLRDDLEVEPDPATTALYQTLLPARTGRAPVAKKIVAEPPMPTLPAAPRMEEVGYDDARDGLTAPAPVSIRSGIPRVTILPPPSASAQDYYHQLAASLIEDITIGLCRFKAISVVAPHTAWEMSVGGKKGLFRNFGIDYSVETHLQTRESYQQLSVRLVDAATREIMWTDHYPMSPAHVARHYRDLSGRILLSILEKIEHAELARYEGEQDASAYHLFLLGQKQVRALDLPAVRRARRAFKLAVRNCAEFVPAIAGLARTYQVEWILMARGEPELLTEATRLARSAVDIDPDDARGYRELGVCNLYAGRFDESLQGLNLAEERNPQFADLLMDYSDALVHAGEPDKGLTKITQAIDLNPLCPDYYWWVAGSANYQLQRYQDAIQCISHMLDQSPVYRLLAASWAMLGNRGQAHEYVRMTKEIHPDFRVDDWVSVLPFRDPHAAVHYEQGLREAGFD